MSRSSWLWAISHYLNVKGLIFKPIRDVPELRSILIEKFDYAPKNLGTVATLETIASLVGVPEARCLVEFSEPLKQAEKHQKPHPSTTRKIDKDEIKRLRNEGVSICDIAIIAGISRQRVSQICKNK